MNDAAGKRRGMTALGVLGLLCYAVHGGQYLLRRQGENLLWVCHLGALAVGLGLLIRQPGLVAVGTLWLTVGLPLWIYDLASGGEFLPTSLLTHVGGLILGFIGIRRLGLPKGLWWKSAFGLAAIFLVTRVATPPPSNVNLAYRIYPGFERYFFGSHAFYLAGLLALFSVVALGFQVGLRGLGFAPPEKS
jgi:hypothetical protein